MDVKEVVNDDEVDGGRLFKKDEYHINTTCMHYIYHYDSFPLQTFKTYLKHLMAVMVEMKEAKKAADVVKEVTHMVSIEWPKADPTIDSK